MTKCTMIVSKNNEVHFFSCMISSTFFQNHVKKHDFKLFQSKIKKYDVPLKYDISKRNFGLVAKRYSIRMATKICAWRHFFVCNVYCFCGLHLVHQDSTTSLERAFLDHHAFCIRECHREKFCARKRTATTLLLPISRSDCSDNRQDFIQYFVAFVAQYFDIFRF